MKALSGRATLLLAGLLALTGSPTQAAEEPVAVVTLGDSITRGARPGVKVEETFASLLQEGLKAKGVQGRVVNVGIGGERTDQALKRLARDVIARKPRVVTIMYGTNDSYVDQGKKESRLSLEVYRDNLKLLVKQLRDAGITPILMTEPRWAADARPNGVGENPNVRLEKYVAACREVAQQDKVPLVDHHAHWSTVEKNGTVLRGWTTDGCHPNPPGHRVLATLILPVVLDALKPAKEHQ